MHYIQFHILLEEYFYYLLCKFLSLHYLPLG